MDFLGLSSAELQWTLWAVIVGVACTVPCALLGCYLVLRQMSLLGDAISHGVLPGIVVAVLFSGQITGWPIIAGAMVFGILTAVLTQWVHSVGDVPEDASMGVVFSGLFALGVVLVSRQLSQVHLDTDCVLYGIFEAIPAHTFRWFGYRIPMALPTMLGMLTVTLLFICLLWKELKIVSFDPALAAAMGLNATLIHYLLMAMVAGVTVTAFEAVGSVLVIAMLIVPAATAHLLTDRLSSMLLWATLVAVVSTVGGVLLSGPAFLNTSTSGMMAVVAGVQFALAVFLSPRHGIVVRVWRNAQLALRIVSEDILAALYRREEARKKNEEAAAARLNRMIAKASHGAMGWLVVWSLCWRGQLSRSSDGVLQLTAAGRLWAEGIVRSHRLWEAYLDEHFDLPLDHLHEPAERMEHFITPGLREKLASELDQPQVDPHGRVIPPSEPQTN